MKKKVWICSVLKAHISRIKGIDFIYVFSALHNSYDPYVRKKISLNFFTPFLSKIWLPGNQCLIILSFNYPLVGLVICTKVCIILCNWYRPLCKTWIMVSKPLY